MAWVWFVEQSIISNPEYTIKDAHFFVIVFAKPQPPFELHLKSRLHAFLEESEAFIVSKGGEVVSVHHHLYIPGGVTETTWAGGTWTKPMATKAST